MCCFVGLRVGIRKFSTGVGKGLLVVADDLAVWEGVLEFFDFLSGDFGFLAVKLS